MNRSFITYAAVVGAGVGLVCISASSWYFIYKIHNLLQNEIRVITQIVTDIKKDISDLKTSGKRKGLAAGSSFSDETSDVYYDFSDEGEFNMIENDEERNGSCSSLDEDEEQIGETTDILNNSNYKTKNFANNLKREDKRIKKRLIVVNNLLECLAKKPENYLTLHKKILSYHSKYFNKHEYLWRLAKACHICGVISGENGNVQSKREYMESGLKYAKAALALTDDDANVHKWYAICIGSCTEFESIQTKIEYGFIFKKHAQFALQINSTDESLYYLMGRWCYEVALMPWIQQKIAKAIFGTIPTATMQEARNYFLTAENLHCGKGVWKENLLLLAKTYIEESQYEQAIKWLDKAVENESSLPEDPAIIKEILDLQSKYSAYRLDND